MLRREWLLAAVGIVGCKRKSVLPELGMIAPFEFTDQMGKTFASSQLKGKVWVADFFFTNCPGPCPRMSNQLRRVQEETGNLAGVHLVSISVDPDRDTPAAMESFAKRYQAKPDRWTFLTGAKELIRKLMVESFYLGFADTMQEHSTRFVLVDQDMKIRGFYDSFAKDSIDKLIEDIRNLHDRT